MANETTYLWFGALVSCVGTGLIVLHVLQHRHHREDLGLSQPDRQFYDQQYRRRMQTSALAVTLGALIGLCGYLRTAFEKSPVFATCYVIGLLLLSLWLILLALGDAVASHVHSNRVNRRQRKLRQSLQEALVKLRNANDISMRVPESDSRRNNGA